MLKIELILIKLKMNQQLRAYYKHCLLFLMLSPLIYPLHIIIWQRQLFKQHPQRLKLHMCKQLSQQLLFEHIHHSMRCQFHFQLLSVLLLQLHMLRFQKLFVEPMKDSYKRCLNMIRQNLGLINMEDYFTLFIQLSSIHLEVLIPFQFHMLDLFHRKEYSLPGFLTLICKSQQLQCCIFAVHFHHSNHSSRKSLLTFCFLPKPLISIIFRSKYPLIDFLQMKQQLPQIYGEQHNSYR